jgi:hypothetical protein
MPFCLFDQENLAAGNALSIEWVTGKGERVHHLPQAADRGTSTEFPGARVEMLGRASTSRFPDRAPPCRGTLCGGACHSTCRRRSAPSRASRTSKYVTDRRHGSVLSFWWLHLLTSPTSSVRATSAR